MVFDGFRLLHWPITSSVLYRTILTLLISIEYQWNMTGKHTEYRYISNVWYNYDNMDDRIGEIIHE